MAEVFGLSKNGVELDNMSAADSSDDEERENEIKKLLEEGLCNETFDYDSDNSNEVSDSEVNISKLKKTSFNFPEKFAYSNGNNQDIQNISDGHKLNGTTENKVFKEDNNKVKPYYSDSSQQPLSASNSTKYLIGNSSGNVNNSNGFSKISDLVNNKESNSPSGIKSTNHNQSDREDEEIEARNPTISLMHANHCPQNDDNELNLGSNWMNTENNVEQLKTVCKFRERQILKAEETIATLSKDKRALNHHVALMKSEMTQMKTQQSELENLVGIKEEEVAYLKSKIREAIEEYEQVRKREIVSKDECCRLQSEVEKLQQEIKLLSVIGTSSQQAEVDQLVRQMREKHARDTVAWQKVVNELEGQIRLYKRAQQLLHEESFSVVKNSVEVQTEGMFESPGSEDRERELAEKEFRNEFGAGDINNFPSENVCNCKHSTAINNIDEKIRLKVDECKSQWEIEKKEIINFYEIEIDAYRSRLTTLPAKLYETWQKTQDALGLSSPTKRKPESKHVATSTDVETGSYDVQEEVTQKDTIEKSAKTTDVFRESSLVITSPVNEMHNVPVANEMENKISPLSRNGSSQEVETSSAFIQTEQKETSSVVIQTEETLETYNILAGLIEQWAAEVAQNSERAKKAEQQVKIADEELNKLRKKFKYLQKMATSCRKEWKRQEDNLKKTNADLKAHYVSILLKVNEKLEGIEIE